MRRAKQSALPAQKTILVVDDHPVLRRGIASLVAPEPDLAISGEASSCAAAMAAIRRSAPDIVVLDLALDGCDGLDLIKTLKARYPRIPALVLSMRDEAVYAERALRAGARGFVSKRHRDSALLAAIRRVLDGEMYLSDAMKTLFATKFVTGHTLRTESPVHLLSDRELQVFQLIGQGFGTREIADTLSLSVKTVESHREHIKHKLSLQSAAKLAQRATQWVESDRTS